MENEQRAFKTRSTTRSTCLSEIHPAFESLEGESAPLHPYVRSEVGGFLPLAAYHHRQTKTKEENEIPMIIAKQICSLSLFLFYKQS